MEYGMGIQSADGRLNKRRRRSAIRREAIKFTKIVSLVGIRHATDGRNSAVRRFVWIVWLVVGFGFAIYQIQDRIDYYCQLPTVTVFKMILSEELLLPQVTICNENEVVTTKAKELGFQNYTKLLDAKMKKLDEKNQANDSIGKDEALKDLNLFLDTFHDFLKDRKDLSKNLSLSAKESIIAVTFDGVDNRSFIEEILTDNGHCFAFSTKNNPLTSKKAGSSSGLFLVLSVSRKDYEHSSDFEPGYKMLIHNADAIPRMKEAGDVLKPGVITRIAVSLEEVHQLGEPYGKCKPDPDYNEENCLVKSNCKPFFEKCGCVTMDMMPLDEKCDKSFAELMNSSRTEIPVCSFANRHNCTVVKRDLFLSTETNETDCPRQCNSSLYTTTRTVSSIPMLMNEPSLNVQGDSQILDRVRVYVYYDDLSYMEVINQPEYLIFELLCDVGGALSLLLGATLLTVYEGGEFLLLFARDYLNLRLAK